MSIALADRESVITAALPHGALAVLLMLAVVLHLAAAAALYWAAPDAGTMADGQGGLTVGLGPAGTAPGAVVSVEADRVDAVMPEAAPPVQATATAPDVPPPLVPVVPVPAPADSLDLARSLDPVVATPETVTVTEPQAGLGLSRRPAARPRSVEEAAARDEADRDTEGAAPQRAAAPGRQGRSDAAQSAPRGGGDDAAGGGSPGARADFAARVAASLARAKQYPRSAQRARMEGTGTVWFRMNAAGQVTAAHLTQGTGHAELNRAIIDTLRRARLPAIPDGLGRAQMEFSVPISFTLR